MKNVTKNSKTVIRWLLIVGIPLVLVAAGVPLAFFLLQSGPDDSGPTLFVIQRSKNKNEVHYDIQADDNGALGDEPVIAYWVMKADDGSREDLTYFEREMAYGFEVMEPNDNGDREMKLVAWDERTIRLTQVEDSGRWRAVTTINGEDAYLNRLFIQTDEGGVTPSVEYVDLFGETVDGGDAIKERVNND